MRLIWVKRKVIFNMNKRDVGGTRRERISNRTWAKECDIRSRGQLEVQFQRKLSRLRNGKRAEVEPR